MSCRLRPSKKAKFAIGAHGAFAALDRAPHALGIAPRIELSGLAQGSMMLNKLYKYLAFGIRALRNLTEAEVH